MTPEDFVKREMEIQQASLEYPGMEIGGAYRKWKEARGEKPAPMLLTGDKSVEAAKQVLREGAKKPCTQEGCDGTMELESICAGCVEGRKGFKSRWICEKCLHRELSTKDFMTWLKEFASVVDIST